VHRTGYRRIVEKVPFGLDRPDATTGRSPRHLVARGRSGRRWSTALVAVVVAAVGSISLLALGGLTAVPASAASGAPAVSQCNPPDFPTGAGYQVTCTVSVDNYTSPSGGTISTVTTSACLAAAGVVYPSCPLNLGPVVSTTSSFQLVTSVNQCNGIANGAGSNVYCNVTVTNHIPAGTTESGVTVDQCVGSAATSTQACAPLGSTTNATVTQCNGSANGGGTYASELAAGCTVTGADSALPVTINQCNGTSNGGGSAVTCMATVSDVFVPASTTSTTPTPAASGTGGTTAAGGTAAGGTAAGGTAAGGLAGGSGGAVGAGGSTGTGSGAGGASGTVASVIPTGAPQTGFGGASLSTSPALVYVGGVALTAAGLTMLLAIRRRRAAVVSSHQNHLS
jgi:hypothetical protein